MNVAESGLAVSNAYLLSTEFHILIFFVEEFQKTADEVESEMQWDGNYPNLPYLIFW